MAAIPTWSPVLSVRNPELDEQHIVLLELGRHLVDMLSAGELPGDAVPDLLTEIIELSQRHDAQEEQLLAANGCPAAILAEHRMQHQATLEKLGFFLARAAQGDLDKSLLADAISDWMGHHLSETDLPVREFFKDRPPASVS